MNTTKYELIGVTVEFFPRHKKMPFMSSTYRATLAASYLTEALLHPNPVAPFAHIGKIHLESLRKLATLFQALLTKPGAPTRVVHVSPTQRLIKPEPPRVETPAPPRVAHRITAPYPRVVTPNTPVPTMPSHCTTQLMARSNLPTEPHKTIMISQKEVKIISALNHQDLTHLFSGPGAIEYQYRFKGFFPLGQEQQFTNDLIDPETGSAM